MRSLRFLLFALFAAAIGLYSQAISTSQINGTVQDSSGLGVPGAEVKATQTETGLVRTVTSASDGSYILTSLPVGPYQMEVSKDGFSKYVQSGIILQVGSNPTVDVSLKVGAVTEQVQVEANAALVETKNAGIGQVIDNKRVLELPLNGRQVTELIYLSGMATTVNGAGLNSGVRNFPTVNISVAGGLSNGLTFRLDGGTHNDPYNNLNLPLPFPDALQEFKVETSALPAQYGHHSAAAVNGVTKSGTNEMHGDLFWFIRNGAVNSRYTFAPTVDQLKRNQFGGTIGGPITKNKLFYFAGVQGTLLRSAPATNAANVPTAKMLAGDFTGCVTSALGAPFTNNVVNPALFSQAAKRLVNLAGFPKASDASCGAVQFGRRINSDQWDSLGRVDYQKSDNHSLFLRYLQAKLDQPSDYDPANLLTASTANLGFRTQSVVLGDTYLIGAGTVNSFRGTFNRSAVPKINPDIFGPSDLGINMWEGVPELMRITVNPGTRGVGQGFAIASNNVSPSIYNTTNFELSDDVSLVRGSHQIGFGVDFIRGYINASSGLNATGPFTFNGQTTGSGLADFLLGKVSGFTQATTTLVYDRHNYIGMYIQDQWKILPRLTLSYGVRWDPSLPVTSKYGWFSRFDQGLFDQNVKSTVYTRAPAGLQFVGDTQYKTGEGVVNARLNNFAPRIALAWDPFGNGTTSIRAAYGRFFDIPGFNNYISLSQAAPFGNQTSPAYPAAYNNTDYFTNPWATTTTGNPYPLTLSANAPFIPFGAFTTYPTDPKSTYSQQWNVSVQRQIGKDWIVTANYVGSNTIHIWGGDQYNPGLFGAGATTGNVNARRFLNQRNAANGGLYGSVTQLSDGGTASYNGLLFSTNKRMAKGYSIQANYTLSHCITDQQNPELGVAGLNYMVPGDRRRDRGNCTLGDRRHVFNLSAVFETPKFAGRTTRLLASGWQLSPIIRMQTGPYLTVTTGIDQALSGQGTNIQRVNQTLVDPYLPNKGPDGYLNPAAFAQPTLGTYGNLGLNTLRTPGALYVNAAVSRTFQIREKQSVQIRFEGFNLPNRANWGPPNGLTGNGSATTNSGFVTPTAAFNAGSIFGKIRSTDDPRILQGAIKYVF